MSQHESLKTQMEHETELIALSGKTADFREGIKAFAEKRKPIFTGQEEGGTNIHTPLNCR